MCAPKPQQPGSNTPPPPPAPVADRLSIDPSKRRDPLLGDRSGKGSLVISRSVGGLDTGGSGLAIGK